MKNALKKIPSLQIPVLAAAAIVALSAITWRLLAQPDAGDKVEKLIAAILILVGILSNGKIRTEERVAADHASKHPPPLSDTGASLPPAEAPQLVPPKDGAP